MSSPKTSPETAPRYDSGITSGQRSTLGIVFEKKDYEPRINVHLEIFVLTRQWLSGDRDDCSAELH